MEGHSQRTKKQFHSSDKYTNFIDELDLRMLTRIILITNMYAPLLDV